KRNHGGIRATTLPRAFRGRGRCPAARCAGRDRSRPHGRTLNVASAGPGLGERFERLPASVRKHLDKLGLHSAFDLVLHLPLRYEDETRITALRDARAGETVQVEAVVEASEVVFRPRRLLLCRTRSGGEPLTLRFFHF